MKSECVSECWGVKYSKLTSSLCFHWTWSNSLENSCTCSCAFYILYICFFSSVEKHLHQLPAVVKYMCFTPLISSSRFSNPLCFLSSSISATTVPLLPPVFDLAPPVFMSFERGDIRGQVSKSSSLWLFSSDTHVRWMCGGLFCSCHRERYRTSVQWFIHTVAEEKNQNNTTDGQWRKRVVVTVLPV